MSKHDRISCAIIVFGGLASVAICALTYGWYYYPVTTTIIAIPSFAFLVLVLIVVVKRQERKRSQRQHEIPIDVPYTTTQPPAMTCDFCGATGYPDKHGNCSACGAPPRQPIRHMRDDETFIV